MYCEMCGKESELIKTTVENVTLKLCESCSRYGKTIEEKIINKTKVLKLQESQENLIEGYGNIIKSAREKQKLTQEELALKIKEKLSLISKIERGEIKPMIETARRIEKQLAIKIIENILQIKPDNTVSAGSLTIGDMIKKK